LPDTDKDTQRETILLTDAELDAVVGGAVALHDFAIVKHVDKASPKLYETLLSGGAPVSPRHRAGDRLEAEAW
jgi:type VI protein secretion system component Hcp